MRKIDSRFYYHAFNRGVDKRLIFMDTEDHIRFLESVLFFNYADIYKDINELKTEYRIKGTKMTLLDIQRPNGRKLVEIVAYALCGNHYHFILKELVPGGIAKFMKRLNDGYTKYINNKYSRTGSLLEGKYKSVEFRKTDHILKLSAYVNFNAEIHGLKGSDDWRWSSKNEFLGTEPNYNLCHPEFVLSEFGKTKKLQVINYKVFCKNEVKRSQERKRLLKELA